MRKRMSCARRQSCRTGQDVCVAGRVTAIRRMGKLSFVTLSDMEGKLQIAVMRDEVARTRMTFFKRGFDVGATLWARRARDVHDKGGRKDAAREVYHVFRQGVPSAAEKFTVFRTRSFVGAGGTSICMNGETRRRFLFKSQLVREIRRYLEDNGYIEIETPVLIDHPSGATARPFVAHHNALDMDVYLGDAGDGVFEACHCGWVAEGV